MEYKDNLAKERLVTKEGEEDRIKQIILINWGKDKKGKLKKVYHWSGWDIAQRAEKAGKDYEFFYHESFALLSWYIHSGLVGIKGMSTETLSTIFGNSHMLAVPIFLDATLLVAQELKLIQAVPQLKDWIKEANLAVGKVIIEEHLKSIDSENTSK